VTALLLAFALILWAWYSPPKGGIALGAALLACALGPFLVAQEPLILRLGACGYAVIFATKFWERSHGRIHDRRLWGHFRIFLFWWWIPPDLRLPRDATQASATRKEGRTRIARGVLKMAANAVLTNLRPSPPCEVVGYLAYSLWSLLNIYTLLSGAVDLVSGFAMQSGIHVRENFNRPIFSRSPREFWSLRWNLYVRGFAYRNIFLPSGGTRHPAASVMFVFLVSGLMHEYLLIACAGRWSPFAGWTLLYFLGHGGAVVLQAALEARRPRASRRETPTLRTALAISLHILWMIASGPLFFIPLDEATQFSSW